MVSDNKLALVFRAKNHKLRTLILAHLDEIGGSTVTDLFIHFRLEQSVASQHLAILRRAGLVKTDRRGKTRFYEVDADNLQLVAALEKAWAIREDVTTAQYICNVVDAAISGAKVFKAAAKGTKK